MNFNSDIVIGMECHIQLNTKTKLFCGCPTSGNEAPNTRCCPTCLGMPGAKPRLNKTAVEQALKLCVALGSKIAPELVFSRKNYFYMDLAKNYQISQYDMPLGIGGVLTLKSGKEIALKRIHMEEDPAALIHPQGMGKSKQVLIDYNRSGNPLVELVTEPVLTSPEEARQFMQQLVAVLKYLDIFAPGEQALKADANISIKKTGYQRVEVKNITGFKEIERALQYEIKRQQEGNVEVETRAWDADQGITLSLRKKETEEEYGYIVDPDIPVVEMSKSMQAQAKKSLPELPHAKATRFVAEHKLREEDAQVIAQEKALAELFEEALAHVPASLAVTWIRHELNRVLNYHKKELEEVELDKAQMLVLMKLVHEKKISDRVAQKLLEQLIEKRFDVAAHVKKEGLEVVADTGALEQYCKEAIAESEEAVKDYQSGNEKAVHFIVGKVMKKTRGAASAQEVLAMLKDLLQ